MVVDVVEVLEVVVVDDSLGACTVSGMIPSFTSLPMKPAVSPSRSAAVTVCRWTVRSPAGPDDLELVDRDQLSLSEAQEVRRRRDVGIGEQRPEAGRGGRSGHRDDRPRRAPEPVVVLVAGDGQRHAAHDRLQDHRVVHRHHVGVLSCLMSRRSAGVAAASRVCAGRSARPRPW